ncbi:MAG: circularly permuted type 2 ATP-grasp protein [Verrucomicrobiae bacterium]|nr:circularly permuted type 2 ATP-grasp protein [Verrucomicrobiae bacterium]
MSPAESAGQLVPTDVYRPESGERDESIQADGRPVPAWEEFFESYQRHGKSGLREWREVAMRISRDRGLAYRPDRGEGPHWSLDPVPWVFSPEDWQGIENGVAQLIRLASAVLADLYGEQTLLDRGVIPASVVLGHRGFLRALHDCPPGDRVIGLGMSAFDLARSPGGVTHVLNGRFDCPYGLGVALENRTVVNRVLPNLFRRCRVRRIGYFFNEWFDYLAERSPSGSPDSRIVILDSDSGSENSEIGFLANYCGITRVLPSDLTVRNGTVSLKALSGLMPVDVIWKVTHGRDLDPLEANWRWTAEGVPGIFEAIRRGTVAVASHPGAEVLQSPGFFPFLPQLCRELLGEELILPPVKTWWCGDPVSRRHVLDNLSGMVIKSVGHHGDFRTRYGQRLSTAELADLRARIEAHPDQFVGQEQLQISTVPASIEGELVPRGAVLRTFCFLDGKGTPHVMPGGLGRVSTAEGVIISTRESGESKDIWVRSHAPDAPISIERRLEKSKVISPEVVPSRRGENLYWAGRYGERTDAIVRFANRLVNGRTAGFSYGRDLEFRHEKTLVEALFRLFEADSLLEGIDSPDERLALVLADPDCPAGIRANLGSFHRASMAAREEWSLTSILAIESARSRWFNGTSLQFESPYRYEDALNNLALNLAAFHGLNLDSMTRDEAWGLLDAGSRIERMSILVSLLAFVLEVDEPAPMGTLLSESVLFVSDSLGTYQTKFHSVPRTGYALRLLLSEEDYPRSLRYLLERLDSVLRKVERPERQAVPRERIVPMKKELMAFLEKLGEGEVFGGEERRAALVFLESMQVRLNDLHDYLTTTYFSHAGYHG